MDVHSDTLTFCKPDDYLEGHFPEALEATLNKGNANETTFEPNRSVTRLPVLYSINLIGTWRNMSALVQRQKLLLGPCERDNIVRAARPCFDFSVYR